mgnify:CR=1 FL=1
MPASRAPLDHRLAAHTPRTEIVATPLVRTHATLRVDRPDEIAATVVGAMLLSRVASFGQSRVPHRVVDEVLARATAGLTPEEVMHLEVEAYEILDWLVGGEERASDERLQTARRDGEVVLYDPNASVVELVQRAIDEGFDVRIDYFSRSRGEMNTRRITPRAIDAETYVRAWCHARRDDRVFRLNRITRCVPISGLPVSVGQHTSQHDQPDRAPEQISLSLLDP